MNPCIEQFNDIIGIYPIAVEQLTFPVPIGSQSQSVTPAKMGVSSWDDLLAATDCFLTAADHTATNRTETLLQPKATLKATSQLQRSGTVWAVAASFEVSALPIYIDADLDALKNKAHHLVVLTGSGDYLLARAIDTAYKCEVNANVGETSNTGIAISLTNINGVHKIVL